MGVAHVSHAGIIDAGYSNGDSIQLVNDLTLQRDGAQGSQLSLVKPRAVTIRWRSSFP